MTTKSCVVTERLIMLIILLTQQAECELAKTLLYSTIHPLIQIHQN